jgi:hypothetical protein
MRRCATGRKPSDTTRRLGTATAAQTRYNVALTLAQRGRLGDGLLWAQAALRDFESYSGRAADIAQTRQLIAAIERGLAGGQG